MHLISEIKIGFGIRFQMQQHNCCVFPKIIDGRMANSAEKCGLYFRTLPELIHHIEEEHIPILHSNRMAELKQIREQFSNDPENFEKAYAVFLSQPVPLSLISKLKPFPKGHKVQPIPPPKPRTLKFCHYKPKPPPLQQHTQTEIASHMKEYEQVAGMEMVDSLSRQPSQILPNPKKTHTSDAKFRHGSASLSKSATPELINGQSTVQDASQKATSAIEEKKHRCPVEGCNKNYKNQQGLKQHLRAAHSSLSVDPNQLMATKLSASEEGILSRQLPGRQSPLVRSDSTKPTQETTLGTIVSQTGITTSARYPCQQCGKEFKGLKGFSNLNKHLFEAHQIVVASPSSSVHSSRYPSPSPLSNVQSIYSPQQSPQRPISTGNAIAVLSTPKGNGQLQQSLSQNAFIAPTLTPRHHQQASLHQTARPSAPIPPSTPPSSGTLPQQQSIGYSPQHYPQQQSIRTHQGHFDSQEQIQQQQQYFVAAHAQSPLSNDQQPPVLQPQQQPAPQNTHNQRRFYSYQQQQPQQFMQRQMLDQQQQAPQYSSAHTYAYPSSQPQMGTTTTILLAPGSNLANTGGPPNQTGYGIQQMEYETHHDNYSRQYYRQQPHYMVEQVPGQQQQQQPPLYAQQSPHHHLQTSNSRMAQGNVRLSGPQYIQQQGVVVPQQQAQYQPIFAQQRGGIYQEPTQPVQQQQPYMATTIRAAPVQMQQRAYQQPPQQFYSSQQQQRPGNSQRQSPATVAAVLAAASPQQGSASPSVYALQQQTQQPIGGFVQPHQ